MAAIGKEHHLPNNTHREKDVLLHLNAAASSFKDCNTGRKRRAVAAARGGGRCGKDMEWRRRLHHQPPATRPHQQSAIFAKQGMDEPPCDGEEPAVQILGLPARAERLHPSNSPTAKELPMVRRDKVQGAATGGNHRENHAQNAKYAQGPATRAYSTSIAGVLLPTPSWEGRVYITTSRRKP